MTRRLIVWWLSALLLAGSGMVFAQTFTGVITGTVTDSSSAAVEGAKITLTNASTGEVRAFTTLPDGRYAFSQLNPGTYSMTVNKAGFRQFVANEVHVDPGQTRELNAALTVGDVAQSVEVSVALDVINTQSATQETTLSNKVVQELPAFARNPLVFFNTQAGAIAPRTGVSTSDQEQNQNRYSINGARDEQVLVLIDGIPNSTGDWGGAIATPGMDSVKEFQVIRNAYDARYGRTGGGVVSITTKGGEQRYHGTAFEYLQNSALNANDFFNNRNRIRKTSYRRNDFGGNFGGPIAKKINLYGFYGIEVLRQKAPLTRITTLPTALEKTGDFSQTFNANGTPVQIFDPISTAPDPNRPGFYIRTPTPGNVIPASQLNPVALKVLGLLPGPNQAGSGPARTQNYAASGFTANRNERHDARVDWVSSSRNSMFFRFTKAPQESIPTTFFPLAVEATRNGRTPRWNMALGDTFIVSPTFIVTALFGGGKFTESNVSAAYPYDSTQLGFPAGLVSQFDTPLPPTFNLSGYFSPGSSSSTMYSVAARSLFSYGIHASKQFRLHMLQFGGYVNRYWLALNQTQSATFNFDRFFTAGPDPDVRGNINSGNTLASFLRGAGAGGDAPRNAAPYTTQAHWNFYVQDAWKLTPRLTVNVGVAYELQRARTERYNRLDWFDFNAPSPLAQSSGITGLIGGPQFVTSSDPFQWKAPHTDFAPRVGLAYKISDHLVWRGGYGIYYTPTVSVGPLGNDGFSIDSTWQSTLDNGRTPYNVVSNPFPTGISTPTGSSAGLATLAGFSLTTFQRNRPTPYLQQYSTDLQFGVPAKGMVFELGYSGSQGRKLSYGYGGFYVGMNINQVPDSALALGNALNQQVNNPFAGIIKSGPLSQPTVLRSQLLRPYPQFQNIYILDMPGASSSFNALVTRFTQRLKSGLSLMASYQYSHAEDNASEDQGWEVNDQFRNYYNLSLERSVSAHDVPHSFALTGVWELPLGRGKRFGSSMNRVVDKVVGGWQTSAIWTLQSGLPLLFSAPVNQFNYSTWQFPNLVPGQSLTVPGRSLSKWFNTAAFSQPSPFTYGNAPRYVGDIRYSRTNNWNISVAKSFPLWKESLKAQFRAEMFNAFNRVQFGRANTTFGDPSFGIVSGEGPGAGPRYIQMALRIQF